MGSRASAGRLPARPRPRRAPSRPARTRGLAVCAPGAGPTALAPPGPHAVGKGETGDFAENVPRYLSAGPTSIRVFSQRHRPWCDQVYDHGRWNPEPPEQKVLPVDLSLAFIGQHSPPRFLGRTRSRDPGLSLPGGARPSLELGHGDAAGPVSEAAGLKSQQVPAITLCRGLGRVFVGTILQPICEADCVIPASQHRMGGHGTCSGWRR